MTQLSFDFNPNYCDKCGLPKWDGANTGGVCSCQPPLLKGWVCPICNTPWSPFMQTCTTCNPNYVTFKVTS